MTDVKSHKPLWKRLLVWGGGVLAGLVLVLAGFLLWLDSDGGHRWLARQIEQRTESPAFRLDVGGISGSVYSRFAVSQIRIADAQGIWLEAGPVTMDWQPLDLLGGTLTLHDLGGGTVRILRLPEAGAEETGSLTLPFDRLHLAAFHARIEPAFLETGQVFVLSGKADAGRGVPWQANVSLAPDGGGAENSDSLDASLEWQPSERRLEADIALQAPANGFLASLAGTGAYGDGHLDLQLAGPLEQLSGRLEARLGEVFAFAAGIAEGDGAVRLSGETRYGGLLPAGLAQYAGAGAQFDIAFRFPVPGQVLVEGTAGNEQLRIGFEGPVLWQGGGPQFENTEVRASMDQLVLDAQDIRAERLQLTARLSGPVLRPDIGFEASADSLGLPQAVFTEMTANGTLMPRQGIWQADGSARAGAVQSDVLDPYLADAGLVLDFSALLAGEEARNINLRVRQGPWQATASGTLSYDLENFGLDAGLDMAALGDVPGFTSIVIAGAGQLAVSISRQNREFSANGDLALTGAQYGQDMLAALLGSSPRLSFSLDREAVRIDLESLDLRAAGLALAVDGTVSPEGQLSLEYTARLPANADLAPELLADAAGRLTVTGRLTGQALDPAVTFATGLDRLDTGMGVVRNLQLRGNAESLVENPAGSITLTGETAMAPVELSAVFRQQPAGLAFEAIRLSAAPFEAEGEVLLAESGLLDGRISIRNRQEALGEATGRRTEGTLDLSLVLMPREGAQGISLSGNMQNLRIIPLQGTITDFDSLAVTLEGRFGANAPDLSLSLEGRGLTRGFMRLESISFAASGWPAMDYSLAAEGAYFRPLSLDATGTLAPANAGRQLTLDFAAAIGGQELTTSEPLTLTFGGRAFSLDVPGLVSGAGRMSIQAERDANGLTAYLSSDNFPVRLITFPWPRYEAQGQLSSETRLAFTDEQTTADWQVTARDLRFPFLSESEVPPVLLESNGTLADGMLSGLITMTGQAADTGEQSSGRLQVRLPLVAGGENGLPRLDVDAPLAAELEWDAPAAHLWGFMRQPDHILEGHVEGNLDVSGTLNNPDFIGTLRLDGGAYQHRLTGFSLAGLEAELNGRDGEVLITRLEGHDGAGGTVSGRGRIRILENLDFPAEITATAESLRILRLPSVQATASGNVAYTRGPDGNSITGDITTDTVNIEMIRSLPRNVVELEVREINSTDETAPRADGEASAIPPRLARFASEPERSALDMTITVPGRMFVRGRGLDSEWQGDLAVGGTTDQPVLNGAVRIVRGSFTFAGKRFDLTSGNIQFDGGRTIDPLINITSRASTPTLDATVALTGRLSSPQIRISSTPALPEDEILSRLLFGTSVAELSPLQIAELAAAVNSLRGGGGMDVLGGARRTLGLDTLTLASGAVEEGSLIRGGKYLSDNIYLELETATASGDTLTRLRIDLTDNIRAETAVGPSNRNSIKLKWFWDY